MNHDHLVLKQPAAILAITLALIMLMVMPVAAEDTGLGAAVDAPDLVWTTGNNVDWTVDTEHALTGVSSARSGTISALIGYSEIKTTVTGPGTLTFSWDVSCGDSSSLSFAIDGAEEEAIKGTENTWKEESFPVPEGEHALTWNFHKSMDDEGETCGWLDNVAFTQKLPEPKTLKEALDADNLEWVTVEDKDWTIEVGDGVNGGCARSGAFSADYWESGFSEIQTQVTGPGILKFSWKTSCDQWNDELSFEVDGKSQASIAELDEVWRNVEYEVSPGDHTLKWSYWKSTWNDDESDGKSCGWLDNVSYTQHIATVFTSDVTAGDAPLSVQFTDQSTGDISAWHWDFGDGETSDLQNPSHTYEEGTYDVSLTVTRDGVEDTRTETEYIHSVGVVSLEDAMDAPELTWTTGGDKKWSTVTGPDYKNNAAGKSAGALTCGQNSWLQTTVTGPCTLSYDWKISPGKSTGWMSLSMAKLEFSVDNARPSDALYAYIKSDPKWRHKTFNIGHGQHTLNWTYSTKTTDKEENGGWLDNVNYTYGGGEPVADFVTNVTEDTGFAPLSVQFSDNSTGFPTSWEWDFGDGSELSSEENPVHVFEDADDYTVTLTITNIVGKDESGEDIIGTATVSKTVSVVETIPPGDAADAPDITWTTGGDAEWFADLFSSLKGETSARSGLISSADNTSWIQANVTGPGVLDFNWNINSSGFTYSGLLEFLFDGEELSSIKGTQYGHKDWPHEYYEIAPGEHTFRWIYTNDKLYEEADCGHIDNVTYVFGAIPPVPDFESNMSRTMLGSAIGFTDLSTGCPTSWSWDFGDGETSDEQNPTHLYTALGDYTVTLTASNKASTESVSKMVTVVPVMSLDEATDAPELEWSTGGDAPWDVELDTYLTENCSVQSGSIGDNQESWIQANVTGPGVFNFSWMASSEPRSDYLYFILDGEETEKIFGDNKAWTHMSYDLGFGEHTLLWKYDKDSWSGCYDDCGRLDNVSYTPVDDTDFVADITRGMVPLTVNFTGFSTGNPTLWAWDFGDKESAKGQNQTHTYEFAGTYNVTLLVQKDGSAQMETKNAYITVTPTFETALDAEDQVWRTGGDAPWFVEPGDDFTDGCCAESGVVKRYQNSWIETDVTGPKNLTFSWNVSSVKAYSMDYSDVLAFSIDGEMQKEIAGTGDGWQEMKYEIESGTHTLRWTYDNRAYSTEGEDCGWLDNVTLSDVAPVLSLSPDPMTIASGTELEVDLLADHLPDGFRNCSVTLSVADDCALITGVESAFADPASVSGLPGKTVTFDLTDDGNSVEAGAENAVLAHLKIKGLGAGKSEIIISDMQAFGDNEEEITVLSRPVQLRVVDLKPFPGLPEIPGDSDSDGLFEDVNGDGSLNFEDVSAYFGNFATIRSHESSEVFDYNGNGRIDFDDIVRLSEHAQENKA